MVSRQKLLGRRKSTSLAPNGGNPFDNQSEFGYMTPDDIRKCKMSAQQEYQEPFVEPRLTTFQDMKNSGANNNCSGSGSGRVYSNEKGRLVEYYSCTLVSNSTPSNLVGMCEFINVSALLTVGVIYVHFDGLRYIVWQNTWLQRYDILYLCSQQPLIRFILVIFFKFYKTEKFARFIFVFQVKTALPFVVLCAFSQLNNSYFMHEVGKIVSILD